MNQLLIGNNGYGDVYGRGDGYGYGCGDGSGDGYGYGREDGYGCGDGYGYGRGDGYGCGDGRGDGSGYEERHGRENFYRDGLSLIIDDLPRVYKTRENHVVEEYICSGEKFFFVTLKGTHYCAHGKSLQQAISDALWKDDTKRPNIEKLCNEIVSDINNRRITLDEFRYITGACSDGCRIALKKKNIDLTPLTVKEIYEHFPEWGKVLLNKLNQYLDQELEEATRGKND